MVVTADDPIVKQNWGDPTSPAYYKVAGKLLIAQPKYSKSPVSDSFLVEYCAIGSRLSSDSDSVLCDQRYYQAILDYAGYWVANKVMRNKVLSDEFLSSYLNAVKSEGRANDPKGTQ
jgi:hypothetical protein